MKESLPCLFKKKKKRKKSLEFMNACTVSVIVASIFDSLYECCSFSISHEQILIKKKKNCLRIRPVPVTTTRCPGDVRQARLYCIFPKTSEPADSQLTGLLPEGRRFYLKRLVPAPHKVKQIRFTENWRSAINLIITL